MSEQVTIADCQKSSGGLSRKFRSTAIGSDGKLYGVIFSDKEFKAGDTLRTDHLEKLPTGAYNHKPPYANAFAAGREALEAVPG